MTTEREVCVFGRDGLRGFLSACARTTDAGSILIRLEQGDEILIPAELLVARPNGDYDIPLGPADLAQARRGNDGTRKVIPLAEERLHAWKELVEDGTVIVKKTVGRREEVIDLPLLKETVDIERVPVERYAEGPVTMWQDGDVLVIPLLEERLVVEKRLVIREELRIRRRRQEAHEPRKVVLRKEDVQVERQSAQQTPSATTCI